MSFETTDFRPLATNGDSWLIWRGALAVNSSDRAFAMVDPQTLTPNYWGQIGTVFYQAPAAAVNRSITGVTRDSAGVILANCRIELYQTGGDMTTMETVSDASGNFRFDNPGSGPFYMVAYKTGAPDVAGTTINTLVAI